MNIILRCGLGSAERTPGNKVQNYQGTPRQECPKGQPREVPVSVLSLGNSSYRIKATFNYLTNFGRRKLSIRVFSWDLSWQMGPFCLMHLFLFSGRERWQ